MIASRVPAITSEFQEELPGTEESMPSLKEIPKKIYPNFHLFHTGQNLISWAPLSATEGDDDSSRPS